MKKKQVILMALSIILALIIGFIIGWKATVLNGNVSFDNTNPSIGYFECWGRVDEYSID